MLFRSGQLTVMAGGTEADVARAGTLMRDLCANYTHMGPAGAGQTTKLVNQLLCAIGFQAVAEAVRRFGVRPLVVVPVMVAKSGDPLLAKEAAAALKERRFSH